MTSALLAILTIFTTLCDMTMARADDDRSGHPISSDLTSSPTEVASSSSPSQEEALPPHPLDSINIDSTVAQPKPAVAYPYFPKASSSSPIQAEALPAPLFESIQVDSTGTESAPGLAYPYYHDDRPSNPTALEPPQPPRPSSPIALYYRSRAPSDLIMIDDPANAAMALGAVAFACYSCYSVWSGFTGRYTHTCFHNHPANTSSDTVRNYLSNNEYFLANWPALVLLYSTLTYLGNYLENSGTGSPAVFGIMTLANLINVIGQGCLLNACAGLHQILYWMLSCFFFLISCSLLTRVL